VPEYDVRLDAQNVFHVEPIRRGKGAGRKNAQRMSSFDAPLWRGEQRTTMRDSASPTGRVTLCSSQDT
jgi:hypothetical protein